MGRSVITVKNLSKRYRLGATLGQNTLREHLTNGLSRLSRSLGFGQPSESVSSDETDDELWAVDDLSFEVRKGEILGIIGRNGAGKSTLLKILSRITTPTRGEIRLQGSVASLLEVGTGFHPELSGRENIYLNGSILGLSRSEIRDRFEAIVDFSGIGRFIDTPVKRYSSGMYVRLAFAVASNLDPDILLLDEVLAVGDAEFQRRCQTKLGAASNRGKTIVLISHNLGVIREVCDRVIVLDRGRAVFEGSPAEATHTYFSQAAPTEPAVALWDHPNRTPGMKRALVSARLTNANGQPASQFAIDDAWTLEISYVNRSGRELLGVGFSIYSRSGVRVGCYNTCMSSSPPYSVPPSGTVRFKLDRLDLGPGGYSIKLSVGDNQQGYLYDEIEAALTFDVETKDIYNSGWLLTPEDGVHIIRADCEIIPEPIPIGNEHD
jgi:lipopolysaccharide transport system ATP-binding protein